MLAHAYVTLGQRKNSVGAYDHSDAIEPMRSEAVEELARRVVNSEQEQARYMLALMDEFERSVYDITRVRDLIADVCDGALSCLSETDDAKERLRKTIQRKARAERTKAIKA